MLRHSSLICLWVQTGSQSRASSPSFLMKLRLVSHQLAAEFFFLLLNLSLRLNLSPCIQHCRDCQLRVQFADALGVFVFCLHNQGNQKSTDGKILGPLKLLRRKQRTMSNLRQPRCSCLACYLSPRGFSPVAKAEVCLNTLWDFNMTVRDVNYREGV